MAPIECIISGLLCATYPFPRQVTHTYLVISAIVLFTTCFIHQTPWIDIADFHTTLYWTLVMVGTMGIPEADSTAAQLIVMTFIILLVIAVPMQVGYLINALSKYSAYGGAYARSKCSQAPHVIVSGYVLWPSVTTLLRELLHPLHGTDARRDVVIVDPQEPSLGMQDMLSDPAFSHVVYIKGSPLDATVLRRARLQDAGAVIVLTNKRGNPEIEDAKATMITAMVSCQATPNNQTPVYAQVRCPLAGVREVPHAVRPTPNGPDQRGPVLLPCLQSTRPP